MKIIIPGLHNSDDDHWQSHMERAFGSDCMRVQQENWDEPNCETWIDAIQNQLAGQDISNCILIGHSIGCMAIVKWHEKYGLVPKGALLVAPTDAEQPNFPDYISGFTPIPSSHLPFPTIMVGSTDDHVSSIVRLEYFARSWGSQLKVLVDAGHIETKSGFGAWHLGMDLVSQLEK